MINGILNIYKEKGYTSFDVVAKLRGILKTKKIGHTGTLDPDAEGVLPVCVGKATKVCALLTEKDKEYEAVMLLGVTTDTQDITGTVTDTKTVDVTKEAVVETIMGFVGESVQIPPMYSALKVGGRKLCDLAREGITVERKPRRITIDSIRIEELALPRVRMAVHCSKGTYIRTLCHDIGQKLKCGACMESLVRTRVSSFDIGDALRLSEIEQLVASEAGEIPPADWHVGMFSFIEAVDTVFLSYEKAVVDPEYEKLLYNGSRLSESCFTGIKKSRSSREPIRVYDTKGEFIGIYQYKAESDDYRPLKMFL